MRHFNYKDRCDNFSYTGRANYFTEDLDKFDTDLSQLVINFLKLDTRLNFKSMNTKANCWTQF